MPVPLTRFATDFTWDVACLDQRTGVNRGRFGFWPNPQPALTPVDSCGSPTGLLSALPRCRR
jgi:hypothetical protein